MQKHPVGLYYLFFTEMWERFSYYGMRALLVYYMTKQLMFAQDKASMIYGLYTGFVYFTPFFGGLLADRYLGQRKTVVIGGVLMAIGHFLMAFESLFFPALTFLVIGNGAFKPNISTQVGNLYPDGDHRRDRAFSLFYMGINLGAFFSPLICGTLGEVYGWHYGFGAAGIGMVVGLIIYLLGQKHLAADNIMKKAAAHDTTPVKMTPEDWKKIWALAILCVINILFWAVYEQQGNTMALFADTNTDRMILGWEMPASWFQSFNPAFVFIFIPVLMWFWGWQDKRGKEPSSIGKMGIGSLLLGVSFLVMIPAGNMIAESGQKVGMSWLTANILILTIGEIYLSPVGLSLVTKLAPKHLVSTMMGMWFFSSFIGNYLSGYIGSFWEKMSRTDFFIMMVALAFATAIAFYAARNPLKHAMGLDKAEDI